MTLLPDSRFQAVLVFTFVRLWVFSAWTTFFPVYLVTKGLTATFIGLVLSSRAAVSTVVSWVTGRVSHGRRSARLVVFALVTAVAALAMSSLFTGPITAFIPATLLGVSAGVTLPLLLVLITEVVPLGLRRLGFGMRMTANQLASATSPPLAGAIIGAAGFAAGFASSAAIGLAAVAAGMHRLNAGLSPDSDS